MEQVLTFGIGENSVTANVFLQDDQIIEDEEQLELAIFRPSIGTIDEERSFALGFIRDNESKLRSLQGRLQYCRILYPYLLKQFEHILEQIVTANWLFLLTGCLEYWQDFIHCGLG